ncbi:MAG: NAD(P)H-dependent oxidoreductase subunit E [Methylacidiphilales bacterium]|nr:NAD(P)H-dependent oxidoreductase subunit E [Candidatus Methylacidiphilales bacterium]
MKEIISVLSKQSLDEINSWKKKYPKEGERSVILAALRIIQHQLGGYLTVQAMDEIAAMLQVPKIAIYEVATFYSMYETKPVGKNVISICTNISCMLVGSGDLLSYVEQKLGIKAGQSTPDGLIYLKLEEECLAACCEAPAIQINHKYYTHVDKIAMDTIIEGLQQESTNSHE